MKHIPKLLILAAASFLLSSCGGTSGTITFPVGPDDRPVIIVIPEK